MIATRRSTTPVLDPSGLRATRRGCQAGRCKSLLALAAARSSTIRAEVSGGTRPDVRRDRRRQAVSKFAEGASRFVVVHRALAEGGHATRRHLGSARVPPARRHGFVAFFWRSGPALTAFAPVLAVVGIHANPPAENNHASEAPREAPGDLVMLAESLSRRARVPQAVFGARAGPCHRAADGAWIARFCARAAGAGWRPVAVPERAIPVANAALAAGLYLSFVGVISHPQAAIRKGLGRLRERLARFFGRWWRHARGGTAEGGNRTRLSSGQGGRGFWWRRPCDHRLGASCRCGGRQARGKPDQANNQQKARRVHWTPLPSTMDQLDAPVFSGFAWKSVWTSQVVLFTERDLEKTPTTVGAPSGPKLVRSQ